MLTVSHSVCATLQAAAHTLHYALIGMRRGGRCTCPKCGLCLKHCTRGRSCDLHNRALCVASWARFTACVCHLTPAHSGDSGRAWPAATKALLATSPGPSPFLGTVLQLLSEQHGHSASGDGGGTASSWGPYLDTLPAAVPPCIMAWTFAEREQLQGE